MKIEFLEIKTTCGNEVEAKKLARLAVEQSLCACAHINKISSFYRWNGSVVDDEEFELVFKAPVESLESIRLLVQKEHSYELPAFYAVPAMNTESGYLTWIKNNSIKPN